MIKIENTDVVGWEAAIRGMRNPMNSWNNSDSFTCFERSEMTNEEIDNTCGKCLQCTTCDIYDFKPHFIFGADDIELAIRLRNAGTDHRKFMRMIAVYCDITAAPYWWKEFKTYRAGRKFGDGEPGIVDDGYLEYDIEMNSCSTMHKIAAKEFTLEDFSHEHLISLTTVNQVLETGDAYTYENGEGLDDHWDAMDLLTMTIDILNFYRNKYINAKTKPLKDESERVGLMKTYWWQMIQLLPSSYNQRRTVMLNYEVLANMYKSRKNHKLDEWRDFCLWIRTLPYSQLITGEFDTKTIAE